MYIYAYMRERERLRVNVRVICRGAEMMGWMEIHHERGMFGWLTQQELGSPTMAVSTLERLRVNVQVICREAEMMGWMDICHDYSVG